MPFIGKKISPLRKLKKLTQKEFASLAEINYRHFQDIEAGKANIRISTAYDIAHNLKVPVETLFDDSLSSNLVGSGVQNWLRTIDCLPAGVCIINLDGRILFMNQFFKKYLTSIDFEKPESEYFVWNLLPSEKVQFAKQLFLKTMKDFPEPKRAKHIYQGPNGTPIEVLVFWEYLRDDTGKILGFISNVMPANSLND